MGTHRGSLVREPLKYSITTKVTGISSNTAGKYAKKPSIRPRFNHGTTTTFDMG